MMMMMIEVTMHGPRVSKLLFFNWNKEYGLIFNTLQETIIILSCKAWQYFKFCIILKHILVQTDTKF